MNQAVIFLGANEDAYTSVEGVKYAGQAGARAYTQGLAKEFRENGKDTVQVYTFKTLQDDSPYAETAGENKLPAKNLIPVSNSEYEKVPFYTENSADEIDADVDDVVLLTLSHFNLDAMLHLRDKLVAQGKKVRMGGVAFLIDDEAYLKTLVENEITVFTQLESFKTIDAELDAQLDRVTMDTVPYVSDQENYPQHYETFKQTKNGIKFQEILDKKQPFANAIVNGGFMGSRSKHLPYTAKEAGEAGKAYAAFLKKKHPGQQTALVLAHGGPRNLVDENMGENTFDAFMEGYREIQGQDVTIIEERFEKGLPYNITKAMLVMANESNCTAHMPCAEGMETTRDARACINNQRVSLLMTASRAMDKDTSGMRYQNLYLENKKGITLIDRAENDDGFILTESPTVTPTPIENNPARQILSHYKLLA